MRSTRRHPAPLPSRAAVALGLALALAPLSARAQAGAPSLAPPPPARPADVASPEAVVKAFFESASTTADWDRFRSLFLPGARVHAVRRDGFGEPHSRAVSIDEHVARATLLSSQDRIEYRELGRKVADYGDVVQVLAGYETRRGAGDVPTSVVRGVQGFQLVRSGGRWWIVDVLSQGEDDAGPLPRDLARR